MDFQKWQKLHFKNTKSGMEWNYCYWNKSRIWKLAFFLSSPLKQQKKERIISKREFVIQLGPTLLFSSIFFVFIYFRVIFKWQKLVISRVLCQKMCRLKFNSFTFFLCRSRALCLTNSFILIRFTLFMYYFLVYFLICVFLVVFH